MAATLFAEDQLTSTAPKPTSQELGAARKRAETAIDLAYRAQPVRQPDRSSLALCWQGRLHRAWALHSQAHAAGNAARARQIADACALLKGQANAAVEEANAAVSAYAGLAVLAGMPINTQALYPPDCQCAGCIERSVVVRMFDAEKALRTLWMELAIPSRDNPTAPPPIIALLAGSGQARLVALGEAMQAYQAAGDAAGKEIAWQETLDLRW